MDVIKFEAPRITPNPGSKEAQKQGCICAVLDNCHGRGFPYRGETNFWITEGCPLHAPKNMETVN